MDRRERFDDPVEAVRAAMEGALAETRTAMPGIVQSYSPKAMTVTVQPGIRGRIELPDGSTKSVNLPLLVDVPVVFPSGGGFTCTFPIHPGDEALVVIADRCIDAWWQSGGVGEPLEMRMHDLSDGFAFVGPRSQARVLPDVDAENVQLRTDDGRAAVTMMPDYTIRAHNPAARVTMTPGGEISGEADTRISLRAPNVDIAANAFSMRNLDGGAVTATITGNINQDGKHTTTGDQIANNISQISHKHTGTEPGSGTSGVPV